MYYLPMMNVFIMYYKHTLVIKGGKKRNIVCYRQILNILSYQTFMGKYQYAPVAAMREVNKYAYRIADNALRIR